jgi:hypothetical protein
MFFKRKSDMPLAEASRVIKEQAAHQPVKIELTEEQLEKLRGQWRQADPSKPLQITFFVADRTVGDLRVASCAYVGDTCCA